MFVHVTGHPRMTLLKIDCMKASQNNFYYITGEGVVAVSSFPLLEKLSGREVSRSCTCAILSMSMLRIDEYGTQHLKELDGKKFKSTIKEGVMLHSTCSKQKKRNNIKLYICRVLSIDNCDDLMPE